jgi:alpha-tubulin suppressor-like RCC1 family protein
VPVFLGRRIVRTGLRAFALMPIPAFVLEWIYENTPDPWYWDPSVLAWGDGYAGQLGDGKKQDSSKPVWVNVHEAWKVAAGVFHSLAISGTGQVWGWGLNSSGQLGDGTYTMRTEPVKMELGYGVKATAIAAGWNHSLVRTTQGRVFECGYGSSYLGPTAPSPRDVGLTNCGKVAAGLNFSLVLREDGTVWAWGSNTHGEFGDGSVGGSRTAPGKVQGLSAVQSIKAGNYHGLALLANGTVAAWGSNEYGQCGLPASTQPIAIPTIVPGVNDVVAVGGGSLHSLAVRADGSLWYWGDVSWIAPPQQKVGPPLAGHPGVSQAAGGNQFTILQVGDGLRAWGDNYHGELGNGANVGVWGNPPVGVVIPHPIASPSIAAGESHALASTAPLPDWMKV